MGSLLPVEGVYPRTLYYSHSVVYVIEFQKRGLPHAHILLWLEERFKCTTPDEINNIISAELPSPAEDLDGYKVVSEYMLHEPYGKDAKYVRCTTEGKCSKHYPKMLLAEAVIDKDKYPIYHRKDNKVTAIKEPMGHQCRFPSHATELSLVESKCSDISRFQKSTGSSRKGRIPISTASKSKVANKPGQSFDQKVLDFDVNKSKVEYEQLHSLLNLEQRLIYDKVIESEHSESDQFYFIHGPGGTGKTFVYMTIIARLRSTQKIVLVVAS
nr:helicase [Tanacetum cinerariifolium]